MFSRSHNNSKNSSSGGGALTSHLFNRRLLPKSTSDRSPNNHSQSVRKTADVPVSTTPSGSSAARRRRDAYDDPSPVQLVSVRRNTEESTSPLGNVESSVPHGRRTKLGLSVAVVRGPSTMSSSGSSATSSLSADVVQDERVNDYHNSADTSVSLASSHVISDVPVQRMKESGELYSLLSFTHINVLLFSCQKMNLRI